MSQVSSSVTYGHGKGGFRTALLQAGDATCEVYAHGAHVTSLRKGDRNVLFLSKEAVFAKDRAIRGGVPVCWPQFGMTGSLPQHGFARTSAWSFGEEKASGGSAFVSLALQQTEETLALWPHGFTLVYHLTLTETSLEMRLSVTASGTTDLEFTTALHSYFALEHDVTEARVAGLQGLDYTEHGKLSSELPETIAVTAETDRIYRNVPRRITLRDGAERVVTIESTPSLPDAVVWNPWIEKAHKMSDFGDEEYHNMICIESAAIANKVIVGKGTTWSGAQTIHF